MLRQRSEGILCATPYGVDVVGIAETVGLVGAITAGVSSRQRKIEVEELNDKLRRINLSLREQARTTNSAAALAQQRSPCSFLVSRISSPFKRWTCSAAGSVRGDLCAGAELRTKQ